MNCKATPAPTKDNSILAEAVFSLKEALAPFAEALADPEFYKDFGRHTLATAISIPVSAIDGAKTMVFDLGLGGVEVILKANEVTYRYLGADNVANIFASGDDAIDKIQAKSTAQIDALKSNSLSGINLTDSEKKQAYLRAEIASLLSGAGALKSVAKAGTKASVKVASLSVAAVKEIGTKLDNFIASAKQITKEDLLALIVRLKVHLTDDFATGLLGNARTYLDANNYENAIKEMVKVVDDVGLKSKFDDLVTKANKLAWTKDSPNFKNGVYEMIQGLPKKGNAKQITLGYKNGKFGEVVPNSSYLRNVDEKTDYVMFEDGSFAFGNGHELLSSGKPVRYAGEIKFKGAKKGIESISNGSGHFNPNAKDLEGIRLVQENLKRQFNYTEEIPFVEHIYPNLK